MTYRGRIGDVAETGRDADVFSMEWRIPDFHSLPGEVGDYYISPDFNACDGEWWFLIYPNGVHPLSKGWMDLFLYRLIDRGPPKTVHITVGVKGVEGVEKKKERRQEFSIDDCACCWYKLFSRSKLREEMSRWMPGNVLTLSVDMKTVLPGDMRGISSFQDSCTQTDGELKELNTGGSELFDKRDSSVQTDHESKDSNFHTEESQSSEKQGIEKVVEDIGKLLVSGENSDVTVQVGDVEFKAHRNILSVRSPVLSAMFRHETAERASNRIVLQDCEPDVFEQFLHYLYNGSIQSVSDQNVFSLYRVADKYLADDLKQRCLEHIRATLSVQTFCEAVKLAVLHGESGLLQLAIDFAARNLPSIIRSVEWQNFIREFPTEANEILIKCIRP